MTALGPRPVAVAPLSVVAGAGVDQPTSGVVRRIVPFMAIGGSVAALGLGLMAGLMAWGLSPVAANAIQLTLTMLVNFYLNASITWRDRRAGADPRDVAVSLARFVTARVAILLLVNAWVFQAVIERIGPDHRWLALVTQAMCIVVAAAANFGADALWSFRARTRQARDLHSAAASS